MNNKFFRQVNFNKNNKSTKIISIGLKNILDEMMKEKNDNGKIIFTFDTSGLDDIDKNLKFGYINDICDMENMYCVKNVEKSEKKNINTLLILLISFYERNYNFSNVNKGITNNINNVNNVNNVINVLKKEKEKIERKKYQERKNKKRKKENVKLKVKNGNPNPKKLNTSLTSEKSKFYYDADEFVQSKQANKVTNGNGKSKNSWKNVEVEKWTSNQFLQYMGHKFNQVYGFSSLEFSVIDGKRYKSSAKGFLFVKIKTKLITVFEEIKLNRQDLKNYIDWMYDVKSGALDFPITLNFLCSKGMMTEWLQKKIKKGKKNVKKGGMNKKIYRPKK